MLGKETIKQHQQKEFNQQQRDRMEEKRKMSTRKKTLQMQRKSIAGSNKKIDFAAHGPISKAGQSKQVEKYLRRIGSKNTISAYKTAIQSQQNKQNSLAVPPSLSTNQQVLAHHLKRIGKQKLVGAYVQSITEHQKSIEISNELSMVEPVITINKVIYGNQKLEKNQSILVDDKEILTAQNTGDVNLTSEILGSECLTQEVLFIKTGSEKEEQNSFSIKIRRIESEDEKEIGGEEVFSAFQKSDECIESVIKTDSDQGASRSDIIEGELNHLINQSFGNSQNESDSKIEELIQEIEKNYSKNCQQAQPVKQPRESQNFLMVPKDQRSSFPKNAKKDKGKEKQKQNNSEIVQLKEEETKLEGQNQKGSTQRSETKRLEIETFQKPKKTNLKKLPQKKTFEMWLEQRKLAQMLKQPIKDSKVRALPSQVQALHVEEQRKKKEKEATRLFASEGPKRTIKIEPQQNIAQSLIKTPSKIGTTKLTQSQVYLQSIKIKQTNQNSKSLHQKRNQKQKVLKKESIAGRFKSKIPKIEDIHSRSGQDIKASTPLQKKNNRQLEVNKCVGEARKLVSKIGSN